MIQPTGLEIRDFGRHRHIKAEFKGKVVGITGPNGLGKTTLLQAVELAFTGGIEVADADKAPLQDWIRKGTRGGSAAKSAEVIMPFLTDGGKQCSITRKITKTTTSRELHVEGMEGSPFSSDAKVSSVMKDLLGVDKRALSSTVFIKQGAIDAMFGRKAERKEFYTRLLMMGHFANMAEVIDGYRKNAASSVTDLSAVFDEALAAERLATDQYEAAEAGLAAAKSCMDQVDAVAGILALFRDQALAMEAITNEAKIVGDDADERLALMELDVKRKRDRIAEINQLKLEAANAEAAATKVIADLREAEQLMEWQTEMEHAVEELERLTKSVDTTNYRQLLEELRNKLDAVTMLPGLQAELSRLEFDVMIGEPSLKGADESLAQASEEYAKARDEASRVRNDLELRERLLSDLQQAEQHSHDVVVCLVCGSNMTAKSYLTDSIEMLRVQLEVRTASEREAFDKLRVAEEHRKKISEQLVKDNAALASVRQKLADVHTTLDGDSRTRDDLLVAIDEANVKSAAQVNATSDMVRLNGVIAQRKSQLDGKPYQAVDGIILLRMQVRDTAAARKQLDPNLDTEAQQLEDAINTKLTEISKLRASVTSLHTARAWLVRVEASLQTQCDIWLPKLPADVVPTSNVITMDAASVMLEELRKRQAAHENAKGILTAARTAMLNAQVRVIDTEQRIDNQKQRLELVAKLERVRDTFKPSGVTAEYLDYKFSRVAELAADYLAESGADFTVVASPNEPLSFDFIRMTPGEEWLSQSRLSGGQRVRLAVATLRAIHALVVPDVGLLVLDEPTTHLDNEAKLAMAEMLRRIGNEGGLQIIVCDHDPIILDACNSVIEIPE